MRHAASQGNIVECDLVAEDMPHEKGHMSLYMYAKALVYISKDCHCHCESIYMLAMSLACILHIF